MARKPRQRAHSKIPAEVRALSQDVGKLIEFWGFKRIHGEVWLHLFLAPEPLDAGDLVVRLKISKSLASICLAELIGYGLIQPAGKSDAGTTLYRANENVIAAIKPVLKMREAVILKKISDGTERLNAPSARVRLLKLLLTRESVRS